MSKVPTPYCTITPTYDHGFSKEVNRYYTMFRVYFSKTQKYYLAYCSCDTYNEVTKEFTNFTIEFLDFVSMSNIDLPYDKKLFEEITLASRDMVADVIFQEKSAASGV